MRKVDLKIFVHELTIDELTPGDQQLLAEAQQACDRAYAPYSNFYVGAAVLLADGTVVLGSNQENAAYPSGLCAERTAIFSASVNYPGQLITAIAVTARRANEMTFVPAAPCGACRQVLLEYEARQQQPIRLILPGLDRMVCVVPSVATLLPLQFTKENL